MNVAVPRSTGRGYAMFGAPLTAAQVVERIVTDVRAGGDGKLLYYTNLIDKAGLSVQNIRVSKAEFAEARQSADAEVVGAIERAIANVRSFHEEQLPKTWLTNRECGAMLGQKVTPVDSVVSTSPVELRLILLR